MKQNEIIEMARQAGLYIATDVNWMPIIGLEYAERLIALARADEREACAKVCDEYADDPVYCGDVIRARGKA